MNLFKDLTSLYWFFFFFRIIVIRRLYTGTLNEELKLNKWPIFSTFKFIVSHSNLKPACQYFLCPNQFIICHTGTFKTGYFRFSWNYFTAYSCSPYLLLSVWSALNILGIWINIHEHNWPPKLILKIQASVWCQVQECFVYLYTYRFIYLYKLSCQIHLFFLPSPNTVYNTLLQQNLCEVVVSCSSIRYYKHQNCSLALQGCYL